MAQLSTHTVILLCALVYRLVLLAALALGAVCALFVFIKLQRDPDEAFLLFLLTARKDPFHRRQA